MSLVYLIISIFKNRKKYLYLLFATLFLALVNLNLYAQNKSKLDIKLVNQDPEALAFYKKLNKRHLFKDTSEINSIAKEVLYKAQNNGFVSAEINVLKKDSLQYELLLNTGFKYKWVRLRASENNLDILKRCGFKESYYNGKPFNMKKVEGIFEKVIKIYENSGYPFASCNLDSIEINRDMVNAKIVITPNQVVKIDSILIKGKSKISPYFIQNYLGIKQGRIYKEENIQSIENRLNELSFVKQSKPYEVTITPKYAKLYLYLENKKANQFDGVIGFMPNQNTGKIQFTGQVHLKLMNTLNRGELLDVDWRKLQLNSRDIKAKLNYPYLLNTPLGIDLNFKLFQRDTIFTDVTQNAGIQYLFSGNSFLKVFYNNRKLSLISTSGLQNLATLPDYADVKTTTYGLGVKFEKTDYRLNPRKGYRVITNGSLGSKLITKNPEVKEELYKDIQLRSPIYSFDLVADVFIPLLKRSVINIGAKTSGLLAQNIFTNEAFRIGGNATLRGFDEETIYATTYVISHAEYRFLLEQNSYFFTFFNKAWYELNTVNNYINDDPYGFGVGISFQTKPGIFSISYALGKQFNNPILLRAAKVHFGIISVF